MAWIRRGVAGEVALAAGALASAALFLCAPSAHGQALPDAPSFLVAHVDSDTTPEAASAPAVEPVTALSSSSATLAENWMDTDPLAVQRVAGQDADSPVQIIQPSAPKFPAPAPCITVKGSTVASSEPELSSSTQRVQLQSCEQNPIQLIVNNAARPLSSREKGVLAVRDFIDPFNLMVITAGAGFSVAANPHSAYGAGFEGWGKLTGYSLLEDAQGEFIGTYMLSSLAHEDPRYHRMPQASVKRRIGHALIHTLWTQHDDGRPMINFETLLTYPASAELSNLYVPGVQTDARSTARRVGVGLATDPVGNLIAEFLPDVAKRIHVRVVFMQQILNQVANGAPAVMQ